MVPMASVARRLKKALPWLRRECLPALKTPTLPINHVAKFIPDKPNPIASARAGYHIDASNRAIRPVAKSTAGATRCAQIKQGRNEAG